MHVQVRLRKVWGVETAQEPGRTGACTKEPLEVMLGDRTASRTPEGDLGVCRLAYRAKDLRGVRENTESAKAAMDAAADVAPAPPPPVRGVVGDAAPWPVMAMSPDSSTGTTLTRERSLRWKVV
jgi:hypothetical protein